MLAPLARSLGRLAAGILLLAGAGTLPEAASALSLTGLSATLGAGNSANLFTDTVASKAARQSGVAVVASSATGFTTRYSAVVASDRENRPTQTITLNARYTITFQVSASVGEAWQLLVGNSRVGALTIVDDGLTGSATAAMTALTVTRSGAGTQTGSLNLAAVTSLTGGASNDRPVSQISSAVISGVGTGALQTVTLSFAWNMSATSTRPAGATNGDEAAVRLGRDSALTGFSADNYPGFGGRVLANDGQFVSVTLVPEPAPWLLTLFGLLGLELMARRHRRLHPPPDEIG